MSERLPPGLVHSYQQILDRMSRRLSGAERDEVKSSIVSLFHETDATLSDLSEFKESIRDLIARFRALPEPEVAAPAVAAASEASVRHDHLGAATFIERGWSALAGAQWVEAEAFLRKAVLHDGTSATALALLAWALMKRGQEAEASELCNKALLISPDHGLTQVVVGAIHLRRGSTASAIERLTRVTRVQGDPRAQLYGNYWLGVAYLERDTPADAEEVLRKAVKLGPNLAEGWLELGHALWRRQRTGEARDAWQRGARVQHSPHAKDCRQMLDTLAAGGVPTRSSPH